MKPCRQWPTRMMGTCLVLLASLLPGNERLFGDDVISLEHIKTLSDPMGGSHGGRAVVLRAMGKDEPGPRVAVVWSGAGYVDTQADFYDVNLNRIGTFAAPGRDMLMCIDSGDVDGDGVTEIALVGRKTEAGVFLVHWNAETNRIEEVWTYLLTNPTAAFYRGVAIGNFSNAGGKEVAFGGNNGILRLLDKDKNEITTYALGGTIQNIDAVDLDGDGYDEMIVATGRSPGRVCAVKYDNATKQFRTLWRTNATQPPSSGDNCYEAVYYPNGHPDGGPAIAVAPEQESLPYEGSVVLLDTAGNILWQKVYANQDGRAGGCDFRDITGDGVPEIITRATGVPGSPTGSVVIYDNQGNRIHHSDAGIGITSSGPYVFDVGNDGSLEMLVSGPYVKVFRIRVNPIPGDANDDGIVNDEDASILAAHWQQTGMNWGDGDFNADGLVDDEDASILAAHWHESHEGAAPVPEPGALGLVTVGFVMLGFHAWRSKWPRPTSRNTNNM